VSLDQPWARRSLRVAVVILSGLLGAWAAVLIAGTNSTSMGPLQIDASIRPSWSGESVVQINPVGSLAVDTHATPMQITLDLRAVDVDQVSQIVDHPEQLSHLDEQLLQDLQDVLISTAVRTAAVALIGGLIAGLLVTRSARRAALSGVTVIAALGLGAGTAVLTYDPEAIQEPRYTGLLQSAPNVVGSAEQIAGNFDVYAEQLAGLITNVSALYETTLTLPSFQPGDNTIRALHVSDLHLNPSAWGVIGAIAEQYEVDLIIDTGDIADHGTALENSYVAPIGDLGRPYVFVKGNHDSDLTVSAVEAQPNAVVLDNEAVEVAGLTILGAPDPRFTPDQETRETASEDLLTATEDTAEVAEQMAEPPDLLAFHDPSNVELFEGLTPLVLSGHTHTRENYILGDITRVMIEGSTGGAGLRALEGEEPTPVSMSMLYFDPDTQDLVAWDEFTLGGLGLSSAEIQRMQAEPLQPIEPDEDGQSGGQPTTTPGPQGTPGG